MALRAVRDAIGVDILLGAQRVARYVSAPETPAFESPRPYLYPITTAAGVPVADFQPDDHTWHHGFSLALPNAGRANLWGGRSWDRDASAYLDRGDNGWMRTESIQVDPAGAVVSSVAWLDAAGERLATEERALAFAEAERGWTLDWESRIHVASPLTLGSPATHGRTGAGYGGLFFRAAPEFRGATATADDGRSGPGDDFRGERARSLALTRPDGAATVVLAVEAETSWFVRSTEYPGFGPAPFDTAEVRVEPGEGWSIRARLLVLDGDDTRRVG
ncbi:PmoA family protein [Leifsonia lichenia]